MSVNVVALGHGFSNKSKEKRSMTVAEARPYLEDLETERQFPPELIIKEAVSSCPPSPAATDPAPLVSPVVLYSACC